MKGEMIHNFVAMLWQTDTNTGCPSPQAADGHTVHTTFGSSTTGTVGSMKRM